MSESQNTLGHALEPYTPAEIAKRVETAGVAKARMAAPQILMLAVLAGAFIALGGMVFTLVMTGADSAVGIDRLIGGIAFSLGLILVVVAGAELFTGNNLIVIAWADRRISTFELLRNWGLVYLGNLAGAFAMVALAALAGVPDIGGGAVGATAAKIAQHKLALPFGQALVSGILCNLLVCLAIWMCFGARRVTGKVLCIVFPISAFVALGFEHSVANMYLIPAGLIAESGLGHALANLGGFLGNLVPVTLGNIIGGGVLVAVVYWVIYRQGRPGT
ncbi:MAG: formate/nitrite transporter family protein [Pseudomonadota bacterium]